MIASGGGLHNSTLAPPTSLFILKNVISDSPYLAIRALLSRFPPPLSPMAVGRCPVLSKESKFPHQQKRQVLNTTTFVSISTQNPAVLQAYHTTKFMLISHKLSRESKAWAPQIRRLWKRVAKNCRWKHPMAPAVRRLWKGEATEAVLELLGEVRAGC